jgi:hypothetical protein
MMSALVTLVLFAEALFRLAERLFVSRNASKRCFDEASLLTKSMKTLTKVFLVNSKRDFSSSAGPILDLSGLMASARPAVSSFRW